MDEFTENRMRLQKGIDAALALFDCTGSAAVCAPIAGTTPVLFIAIGAAQAIIQLLSDQASKAQST